VRPDAGHGGHLAPYRQSIFVQQLDHVGGDPAQPGSVDAPAIHALSAMAGELSATSTASESPASSTEGHYRRAARRVDAL